MLSLSKMQCETPSQCSVYVCIECLPRLRMCNKQEETKKNMALMLLLSRVRQRMPSVMIVEAVIVPAVETFLCQQMSPLR